MSANEAAALRFDTQLADQWLTRAPRLLAYLLVVLIGVRLGFLAVQLAGPPLAADAEAPANPVNTPATRNVVDVPTILRSALFGQAAAAPTSSTNAPVTSLALQLTGVVADQDPKRGFAMIGTTPADIKLYVVGAALPGGAVLDAVYVDRVLLNRGGTIESLLMPLRASPAPPQPPPAVAQSSSAAVGRVQQVLRENPLLFNQVVSRSPVTENGRLVGMRVYPGVNRNAFDKLGLKTGDLVTAINGVQLNDRTRVEEIFNSLATAAEAQVSIMRNGSPQELHLNLAEIANEAERLAQSPANTGPGQPPGPDSAR